MKKLSILFVLLSISVFSFAQTTVKTFDPEGASVIKLDFKHKAADDKKWENETVRLQLEIHTNLSESVMKQLVKAGRYNLEGKREGDAFIITAPNLEKSVTVGGVTLDDQIHVHVERPVWMQLGDGALTVASRNMDKAIKIPVEIAEITFVYNTTATANASSDKPGEVKAGSKTKKQYNSKRASGSDNVPKDAPAAGTLQEMKAQFGEILIDGVVWEVE